MDPPDVDDSEKEPAQFPRRHSSNKFRGGLFILIGMIIGLVAGSAGIWVLKTGPMSPISGAKDFAPQSKCYNRILPTAWLLMSFIQCL